MIGSNSRAKSSPRCSKRSRRSRRAPSRPMRCCPTARCNKSTAYTVKSSTRTSTIICRKHPGAWLVYENGYKELFGFTGQADVQDTLLAGLACALCFAGAVSRWSAAAGWRRSSAQRRSAAGARCGPSSRSAPAWRWQSRRRPVCRILFRYCGTTACPPSLPRR